MTSSDLSYKVRRGIAKAIDGISRDLKRQGLSPFTKEEVAEVMDVMISHFEQSVTKNYKDRKSREETREKGRKKEKEENNDDGSENADVVGTRKEGKGRENTPNFKFKGKFAAECAHFILVRRGIVRKVAIQLGYPAPNPRSDVYRYFPLYGVDVFRATIRHAISRLDLDPRLFDENSKELVGIRERLWNQVKSGFNKLPEQEAADLIRAKCDVPAITILEECAVSDSAVDDSKVSDPAPSKAVPAPPGAFQPQVPSSSGHLWLPQPISPALPRQPMYMAAPTTIVYQNPAADARTSEGSDTKRGQEVFGMYGIGGMRMGGAYPMPNVAPLGSVHAFPAPAVPGLAPAIQGVAPAIQGVAPAIQGVAPTVPGVVPSPPIGGMPVIGVPAGAMNIGMIGVPGMPPPYVVNQGYPPGAYHFRPR